MPHKIKGLIILLLSHQTLGVGTISYNDEGQSDNMPKISTRNQAQERKGKSVAVLAKIRQSVELTLGPANSDSKRSIEQYSWACHEERGISAVQDRLGIR